MLILKIISGYLVENRQDGVKTRDEINREAVTVVQARVEEGLHCSSEIDGMLPIRRLKVEGTGPGD